jgi:hypothetical protein
VTGRIFDNVPNRILEFQTVHIEAISGSSRRYRLIIDGNDISHMVSGLRIEFEAGSPVTIALTTRAVITGAKADPHDTAPPDSDG